MKRISSFPPINILSGEVNGGNEAVVVRTSVPSPLMDNIILKLRDKNYRWFKKLLRFLVIATIISSLGNLLSIATHLPTESGSSEKLVRVIRIMEQLVAALRGPVILFGLSWENYEIFKDEVIGMRLQDDDMTRQYIGMKKRNLHMVMILGLFHSLLWSLRPSVPPKFGFLEENEIFRLIYRALLVCFNFISAIGLALMTHLNMEICIHLTAAFTLVRWRILAFPKNGNQLQDIREVRHLYSLANRMTIAAERFLRNYICHKYLHMVLFCFLGIYDFAAMTGKPFEYVLWVISTILVAINLIFTTSNLVSVNTIASQSYEDLYTLSFESRSNGFLIEVCNSMRNIGRSLQSLWDNQEQYPEMIE